MKTINKVFENWERVEIRYPKTIIKNDDKKSSLFLYLSDEDVVPSSDKVGYEIPYGEEHHHLDD